MGESAIIVSRRAVKGILYIIGIVLLSSVAFSGEESLMSKAKNVQMGGFATHGLDEQGKLTWELKGASAEMGGSIIELRDFFAVFHQKDGRSVELKSPGCRFLQSMKEVKSESPVSVNTKDLFIEGIGYDVYLDQKVIHVRSSVHAVIKGKATSIKLK